MTGNAFPNFSGHIPTTDVLHRRVHQGLFFSLNLFDASLADNGAIEILLRTTEGVHIRPLGALGGDGTLSIFESPTVTSDGTPLVPINHNRFSSIVSTTLAFSGPTTTADGLDLDTHFLPGGSAGAPSQGGTGSLIEWVLKDGLDYLFRLTNLAGTAQPVHIQLDWYEPKGPPTV